MTKYNWDKIDQRWHWVARQKDGGIVGYESIPSLLTNNGTWDYSGEAGRLATVPACLNADILDDWAESLEERPKPEPRYEMAHDRWESTNVLDTATHNYLKMGEILDLLNEREQ
jgi:hypothetical protein